AGRRSGSDPGGIRHDRENARSRTQKGTASQRRRGVKLFRAILGLDQFASRRSFQRSNLLFMPKNQVQTLAICLLSLTSFCAAQTITGTVTNGTTGKPAAGDAVELLSLSQGMQVIGNTKTDAQGHFSFPPPKDSAQAPHMVRATHNGVSYFPQGGPLMPGSTT